MHKWYVFGFLISALSFSQLGCTLDVSLFYADSPSTEQPADFEVQRISERKFTGIESLSESWGAEVSDDGRYVAFTTADPLVASDQNGMTDAYIYDRQTQLFERTSVSTDNAEGNAGSTAGKVSADGRYAIFFSSATNLILNDTNGYSDLFVRDRQLGTTTIVNVSSAGVMANNFSGNADISGDGRYVVFSSSANNLVAGDTNYQDIFLRDLQNQTTIRVSQATSGTQANASSNDPVISADGDHIIFYSNANNLVAGDGNNAPDVFLYKHTANTLEIVSLNNSGAQAFAWNTYSEDISADGRYVLFRSDSSGYVAPDINGSIDLFLRDRLNGTTQIVSLDFLGAQFADGVSWPSMSADGRYIVFSGWQDNLVAGDSNGHYDIFLRDVVGGTTVRTSQSSLNLIENGDSDRPAISADGTTIVFQSMAGNLVTLDPNNNSDIFVFEKDVNNLTRVPADRLGLDGNEFSDTVFMSKTATQFIFISDSYNFVAGDGNWSYDAFVKNIDTGDLDRVSVGALGEESDDSTYEVDISGDGNLIAFASRGSSLVSGDNNGWSDVFVRNLTTSEVKLISKSTAGVIGDGDSDYPAISADGQFVAFVSRASNLVTGDTNGIADVFLHNLTTGETTRVSVDSLGVQGNAMVESERPFLSSDGKKIVFSSRATNLVAGDTNGKIDVFVHDRTTAETKLVSKSTAGVIGNDHSEYASISQDGKKIAFNSYASNLVADDTNAENDTFVHDLETAETVRVSLNSTGSQAASGSYDEAIPSLSGDGRFVSFVSGSSDLVSNDNNLSYDVFVRDLQSGQTVRVSVNAQGLEGDSDCWDAVISYDGTRVAFSSGASNLIEDDKNGEIDVFLAPVKFP